MKAVRFFVTLLTVFAIGATAGCGKSEEQKTQDLVNEGEAKIAAAKANARDLYYTHNINVTEYRWVNWEKYGQDEIRLIEAKLSNQVSFANRVEEIRAHKGITGNISGVRQAGINSEEYLKDLRNYKLKIGMR